MERQHAASLAEKAAQRQLQMRLGQDGLCPSGNAALYGAARASRLCCLALSEELLYRSVLYGWLGMLSEDFRSAEPSAALSLPLALGPAALSALLFGATFTSYHGEWAVGLSLGVLLQAWAVATSSLLPTVVAHATMELILDGYRRRRPLPKPVRTIPTLPLNLVACADRSQQSYCTFGRPSKEPLSQRFARGDRSRSAQRPRPRQGKARKLRAQRRVSNCT